MKHRTHCLYKVILACIALAVGFFNYPAFADIDDPGNLTIGAVEVSAPPLAWERVDHQRHREYGRHQHDGSSNCRGLLA